MKRNGSARGAALGWASVVLGAAFALYDVVLQVVSPGNFLGTVFAFSNVWLLPAAYFVWAGAWRLRHGRGVWASAPRRVRRTAFAAGALCSAAVSSFLIFILTPDIASPQKADGGVFIEQIILLGGGIDGNGELVRPVMRRVEAAAGLYGALAEKPVVVVTGGTDSFREFAEAPEIRRQLILRGVPAERILVEDRARDTIENFRNSAALLCGALGAETDDILSRRTAVVTNRFHLHRAQLIARRTGFSRVTGIAAHDEPLFIPNNYAREILACMKLALRIALTGKPARMDDVRA